MEIKKNKIYLADCIEMSKIIPDESVDLIIADPPYNLNKNFGNESDKWKKVDDWVVWSKQWIDAVVPKLKPTGSIFIYGIHKYLCYLQCYLYEKELFYRRQIIWYYQNGFSQYQNSLSSMYEPILWFSKSETFTYHIIREPYKSTERLKNKITKNGKVWKPNPEGRKGGDIWEIPTLAGKRFANEKVDHPTQKPLELCNKIIKHFSNENDLILVPFAGSGSECLSAKVNNRDFIGFEINPEYIDLANLRLENYEQPNALFGSFEET